MRETQTGEYEGYRWKRERINSMYSGEPKLWLISGEPIVWLTSLLLYNGRLITLVQGI